MPQVTRLPDQIKPLLARLLRTDHDGEAIGCRNAIVRKLQAAGLDAHDLTERIDATAAPAAPSQSDLWPEPRPERGECDDCRGAWNLSAIVYYDPALKLAIVTLVDREGRPSGKGCLSRQSPHLYRLECLCGRWITFPAHALVRKAWSEYKRRERANTS
jgi:hypothetical protein